MKAKLKLNVLGHLRKLIQNSADHLQCLIGPHQNRALKDFNRSLVELRRSNLPLHVALDRYLYSFIRNSMIDPYEIQLDRSTDFVCLRQNNCAVGGDSLVCPALTIGYLHHALDGASVRSFGHIHTPI